MTMTDHAAWGAPVRPEEPERGAAEDRILLWTRVNDLTGISRTTAWRLEREGAFPARVQLSPGRVGWWEGEVTAWMKSRHLARIRPVAGGSGRPRRRAAPGTSPLGPRIAMPEPSADTAARAAMSVPVDLPQVPVPVPVAVPRGRSRRRSRVAVDQLGFDF